MTAPGSGDMTRIAAHALQESPPDPGWIEGGDSTVSRTESETGTKERSGACQEGLEAVPAAAGAGPLLERDYSAAIVGTRFSPEQMGALIREHFVEFAPPETASFRCEGDEKRPLEVGDEMNIRITLRGHCKVRVVHHDTRSMTLCTLEGHPEAGRISFGACRDADGRLMFRILSRTRASGMLNYLGYLFIGKQMQSRCWIRFIDRVASKCGGRVDGRIRVRTRKVAEEPGDRDECDTPTFSCGKESEAG